jgi:ferredoxin
MTEINGKSCCGGNSMESIFKILNARIFIDSAKCTGCGLCAEICPFGLPRLEENGKFTITKPNLCTECSACSRNCPVQAIVMREVEGCGCLWNARARAKNSNQSSNCCQ